MKMERMNAASDYLESQRGRLSEALKKAYLAGQHIVYIVTTDYGVVRDVLRYHPIILTREKAVTIKQPPVVRDGVVVTEGVAAEPQTMFYGVEALQNFNPAEPSICLVTITERAEQNLAVSAGLKKFVEHLGGVAPENKKVNYQRSMVVIVTPVAPDVPAEVAPFCRVLRVGHPSESEIRKLIIEQVLKLDHKHIAEAPGGDTYLRQMVLYMKGLTRQKIQQTLGRIKSELDRVFILPGNQEEFNELVRIIIEEKTQLLENSKILKLQRVSKSMKKVNGMSRLTAWLEMRKRVIANPEEVWRTVRVPQPKGILLSGIPGTGKSLAAKTTAHVFGDLPLLQLDMGNVMDKYQGESEHKIEEALQLAEAMSPCILWIDEIEKGIAGAAGGSGSSESMQRIFGKLLTWMQEKEERGICCFVFATANSIDNIPPELFRSGRFDEKFFTFFPSAKECVDIFLGLVNGQQHAFVAEQRQRGEEHPVHLFDDGILQRDFFAKILDSDVVLPPDSDVVLPVPSSKSPGKVPRDKKFMTGSDIEAIVERAKLIMYYRGQTEQRRGHAVYSTAPFRDAICTAISEIKTYGQTNARNVANCYVQLSEHNFSPVSDEIVVPFDYLDITRLEDDGLPFDLWSEGDNGAVDYYRHLQTKYDQQLFCYVGMAVNQYVKPDNH